MKSPAPTRGHGGRAFDTPQRFGPCGTRILPTASACVTGTMVELLSHVGASGTTRWVSQIGLPAYSRTPACVHYSRKVANVRFVMLADVVVVVLTLLITVRFFIRYGRGR